LGYRWALVEINFPVGNVISKIKQNSSDMNEIILAPCDVISNIKQNSSDMNEIILASCDAGYVQSCTGLIVALHMSLLKLDSVSRHDKNVEALIILELGSPPMPRASNRPKKKTSWHQFRNGFHFCRLI
jgi:hypothetical protein